jgi:ABC-2 type transport system permease protein
MDRTQQMNQPSATKISSTSLVRRSFASELYALLAVAKKEWIIFRRYPSWVVAFFIWPVLFPVGWIFTAKALAGPQGSALPTFGSLAGTTDYISYIVIGSTLYMWLNITLWDVGFHLRNEQMRGTLESNWLCPVWRLSIMLGSSLTKLGTALFFLAIAVFEFRLFFGIRLWQGDPLLLFLILALVIASIYGIGIAFGSLVLRFKEANTMVFLVRGIFLIFCGISYPLEVLPRWMQEVAAFLPLTYAIQAIRAVVLTGATFSEIWPELQMLALFAVVLPIAGSLAFLVTERRARRTGALGKY